MDKTSKLQLPYLLSSQAQKHITHNDALRSLDAIVQLSVVSQNITDPPSSPTEGDRYIVKTNATNEWLGKDLEVAAWQDGSWMFYTPREGWLCWVEDEDALLVWEGNGWGSIGGGTASVNPTALVGVNATADTTNRLSVNSPATLFNHEGDGHQLKVNKNTDTDTASLLFQTGFSGRAEMGLTGDDDFHLKVSPDGSTFFDSIVIDKDTGFASVGANSIQNVPLHVLRDANSLSYQNVLWLSVGNNVGASDYSRYGFFQNSANNMGMEVADQNNTKGTLALQPYGGTISIGAAPTAVTFPGISTTANAANAFLDSGSSNQLLRTTSSIEYKKDIEPLDITYSKALTSLTPIWYRSLAEADNPNWSWYGFSAEDVAAIDPRMVSWGFGTKDYEQVEVNHGDGVKDIKFKLKKDAKTSPQGVLYERFVVHHQLVIKDLLQRIEILEKKTS